MYKSKAKIMTSKMETMKEQSGNIENYDFEQTCRTCTELFNNKLNLIPIFDEGDSTANPIKPKEISINDELTALNLEIKHKDDLPQQICINCMEKLLNVCKFRELCKNSQIKLMEKFKVNNISSLDKIHDANETANDPISYIKSGNNSTSILTELTLNVNEDNEDKIRVEESLAEDLMEIDDIQKNENIFIEEDMNTTGKYICDYCEKECNNKRALKEHVDYSHPNGNFDCKICGKTFVNSFKFKYHVRSHDSNKPYKCSHCDKSFMQWSHRRDHESHHTGEKKYKCEICGKEFRLDSTYKEHLSTHSGILENLKFICEKCGKRFLTACLLRKHNKEKHGPNRQCEVCGRQFKYLQSLQYHHKNHCHNTEYNNKKIKVKKPSIKKKTNENEGSEIKLECTICLMKFGLPSAFEKHMKMHTENRPFKCKDCGSAYKRSVQLKNHINKTHTKAKTYSCNICNKIFLDSSARNFHVKCHEDKQIQCSNCDKKFKNEVYLKRHQRIHTGEKPNQCLICKKCFEGSNQLSNHFKKHTAAEKDAIKSQILANISHTENESTDDNLIENKLTDNNSTDNKSTEKKLTKKKSTENKSN